MEEQTALLAWKVSQSCPTPCDPMDYRAHQDTLFMGFSRQEYWSGLPFPSLGDLPHPGTEPTSSAWQANSLSSESPGKDLVLAEGTASSTKLLTWIELAYLEEEKGMTGKWEGMV